MPLRRLSTDAAKPADRPGGGFDPSTWGGQARSLARNDADAAGLLAAAIIVAADVLGLWAALRLDWLHPRAILSGDSLLLVAIQVGIIALTWVIVYARALRVDTMQVRRTTWQREITLGHDLDGDGIIGQPVGHVVRIRNRNGQEDTFTLPDLDPPPGLRPLRGFPSAPPVTPNDVVWILSQADAGGLGYRYWLKRQLPSGARIDRELWTGILDGLLSWQFAVANQTSDGRRVVALRTDVDSETMIHAVRRGAAAAPAGAAEQQE